ncbi:sugar transferase [Acidicapsa acidisoli]|uniref:sugar transferase n=1 Tax=Acidicapsa acidisoli TaxID=1615681 RepID=UPI0021DFEF08|nr:sugar transferase [Acidicapsa acidisoli]
MIEKQRLTIDLVKLCDLILVVFSFALTTIFIVETESNVPLQQFLSMRTRVVNFGIIALAFLICHVVFSLCGLYRSRRFSRRRMEMVDILKATTLAVACFVVLSSVFSIRMITIHFLAVFWVVSSLVLGIARLTLRFIAARLRVRGRNLRHMLILGTNPRAVDFARRICANKTRGYHLLGFVDNDWPGISALDEANFKVVSDYAGLAEYLRRNVVDEVAIYLPFGSFYRHSSEVASLCQQHGITMRFNSDIFGLKTSRWRAEEFEGDQYITTYTGADELVPRTAKRAFDLILSALALMAFSPLLIVAAIAIKLTSPGPIFFLQERIGLNKRRFKIFKFRTMVPDAEKLMSTLERQNEVTGPVFKIKNDPRITPIGKFLRRSSIDELPQLLNVLIGDMSLVGPRPLPVRDYEGFNEDWQRRRFSVKPGITCLWQVNGRSSISFDQWMLLDLQYMDEWSLWLDFKILVKTVPAVFKGAGAA